MNKYYTYQKKIEKKNRMADSRSRLNTNAILEIKNNTLKQNVTLLLYDLDIHILKKEIESLKTEIKSLNTEIEILKTANY